MIKVFFRSTSYAQFSYIVSYFEFQALGDFHGYFSKWIIIKPELLKVCELADPRAELDNVVETKIKPGQIHQSKDFGEY